MPTVRQGSSPVKSKRRLGRPRLAVAERDRRVTIWDVSSDPPVVVRTLEGHTGGVLDVAWNPDGTRLATGALDGTVRLWDAATGQEVQPGPPYQRCHRGQL
jgi:WD40 repeat protein